MSVSRTMKKAAGPLLLLVLYFSGTNSLLARNIFLAPSEKSVRVAKSHPKLESSLVELTEVYSEKGRVAAENFAGKRGIDVKKDKVKVIIVTKEGAFLSESRLSRWGVKVEGRYRNLVKARVPLASLKEVARRFPEISFIRLPYRPKALHLSEGVSLIGAGDYQSAGVAGAGTKVAIIDLGFINLTETIAHGDLPASVISEDYTGAGIEADTEHGTAVAEIVYDLAPDAELHLLKIDDEVGLGLAKDYCITNGIDIINHSAGWVNTNFYDGAGVVCDIANDARAHGILWVNAAGNEAAGTHWEDTFSDADANNCHDFSLKPLDESNAFFAFDGEVIMAFLTWNDWPASDQDYDLYLIRELWEGGFEEVALSTNLQNGTQEPTEEIYYTVDEWEWGFGAYHIVIYKNSAISDHELELYSFSYFPLQYYNEESSLLAPADATGVVTAGAIDQFDWTTGPLEYFSSQGPTNDGRIKPDLCGPDGTSGYTYGSLNFYGTSASSPHVVGAAALLLSANPGLTADDLQNGLEDNAIEMGEAGKDNLYGSGRLDLPALLEITTTTLAGGRKGEPYEETLSATGGNPPYNWTVIAGALPDGLSLASGGVISGVPTTFGTFSFSIQTTDSSVGIDTQGLSIVVSDAWMLNLSTPYYSKKFPYYSGAASAKMILDFIRGDTILSQDEIYNYGHPRNLPENALLDELDPHGIDAVLGHFDRYDTSDPYGDGDPWHGYNFSVAAHDDFLTYLRDICHWIAYPVTQDYWWLGGELVAEPNAPAVVPLYGTYDHWVVVNGVVTSENPAPDPHINPWYTPDFAVYGLWLTDPVLSGSGGIGEYLYATATECEATYFFPLSTSDPYYGKYLQVAEPPPVGSNARVKKAPPHRGSSAQKIVNLSDASGEMPEQGKSGRNLISLKEGKELLEPILLLEPELAQALEDTLIRRSFKVRRLDNDSTYCLIPFERPAPGGLLTSAVIIIDGDDGDFQQVSWVEEPVSYLSLNRGKAVSLLLRQMKAGHRGPHHARLVWEPGDIFSSPFYPYWEVTVGDATYFVTQEGEILAGADEIPPPAPGEPLPDVR